MDYKYDVFISYSRKDYADTSNSIIPNNAISAIKDAFNKNGITFWFDEEGICSGQEFENIIIDAIGASKVFLFISSVHSNESKWTKSEIWEAFEADKYIIPFKIDDCEYHKNLKFKLRPLDFIQYNGNEKNALKELVRSINNYKAVLAEKQRKEKEHSFHIKIRQQINEISTDYQIQATKQDAIRKDIIELFRKVGIEQKTCPVCEKSVSIDATYCERCGWPFLALPSLTDDKPSINHGLLTTIRANWKCIHQVIDSKAKIAALENDNISLKEELKKMIEDSQKIQATIEVRKQEYNNLTKNLQDTISILKDENTKLKDELNNKNRECTQYQEQINALKTKKASSNTFSSKLISTQEQKTTVQKKKKKKSLRSKSDLFNQVIPLVKVGSGFVFSSDPIKRIDILEFIQILQEGYGLEFTKNDFRYCKKISDVIGVVARKANIRE